MPAIMYYSLGAAGGLTGGMGGSAEVGGKIWPLFGGVFRTGGFGSGCWDGCFFSGIDNSLP